MLGVLINLIFLKKSLLESSHLLLSRLAALQTCWRCLILPVLFSITLESHFLLSYFGLPAPGSFVFLFLGFFLFWRGSFSISLMKKSVLKIFSVFHFPKCHDDVPCYGSISIWYQGRGGLFQSGNTCPSIPPNFFYYFLPFFSSPSLISRIDFLFFF